ncbi:hypothetical protein PR202_gb24923 [Eleusine coracana subsp. coracana]|uniref:Uncharacterized protein n=1 Tax=Eleusine coracana subsp. coracana TaxID=191504 RepID=A0AAV5FN95_ELECO|nr:hypothetical protein QOZ80_5BG0453520 [Eleusine coracana subsp. coracana]GJN36087.1 hypothetical protein PR202_gb24923 [Eleusine coracana subsp. coracana]
MLGDLSLLAVASASPVVFQPSKDLHGVLPFQGKRPQDAAAASAAMQFSAPPQHQHHQLEGIPQTLQMMMPGHQGPAAYQAFPMPDQAALVDLQDSHPDSVPLSLGIAEQCARQEKIVKFLKSGSDLKELDESLLAEFTGQQPLAINLGSQPFIPDDKLSIYEFGLDGLDEPQQYLPETQLVIPDPLVDFAQTHGSSLTIDQDGRVLFNGSGDEMRDLIRFLLEFSMSRREATGCKSALLVPYFDRKRLARANSQVSSSKLASTVADTSKSADVKSKSSSKKKQRGKNIKERNLYQKNYVHASEAFLSILLDKDRNSSTIISLKKAGPEITELLTQCSIGIAGTGLAILLSVVCKMATGMRTPYASTRLLSTSVGFGFFWLSWAVNRLRDTIVSISRSPGNMNLEEDEVAEKLQKSTNEILFRALTLLAITALKFA